MQPSLRGDRRPRHLSGRGRTPYSAHAPPPQRPRQDCQAARLAREVRQAARATGRDRRRHAADPRLRRGAATGLRFWQSRLGRRCPRCASRGRVRPWRARRSRATSTRSWPSLPSARRGPGRCCCSSRCWPTHPLVSGNQPLWTPHRPRAAGEVRGRRAASSWSPTTSPPATSRPRSPSWSPASARRRARPGAARRHRLGQDLHHGQGHRGDPAPGADPGPQQDPGRPALRRVQELLPRQRGRVLRLLLRLLPARSLRPAHRHLHREGKLDQRADRPHAPLGHARDPGARRRDHGRLGLLHLRHRLGRDLHGHDLHPDASASASTSSS